MGFFDPDWNIELIDAAEKGDLAKVQKALEKGANINHRNSNAHAALAGAASAGHKDIVQYLLDRGAGLDVTQGWGTAYEHARKAGYDEIAALIGEAENLRRAKSIPEWSLLGTEKLAHVEVSAALNRKI